MAAVQCRTTAVRRPRNRDAQRHQYVGAWEGVAPVCRCVRRTAARKGKEGKGAFRPKAYWLSSRGGPARRHLSTLSAWGGVRCLPVRRGREAGGERRREMAARDGGASGRRRRREEEGGRREEGGGGRREEGGGRREEGGGRREEGGGRREEGGGRREEGGGRREEGGGRREEEGGRREEGGGRTEEGGGKREEGGGRREEGEAGARTAAPAQEAGSSTAQREKRQETVCISALDSDVWAFLPPNLL